MNDYIKGEPFSCGCYIEYYEGFKDKPDYIIYCPKHKAAPLLYEACKDLLGGVHRRRIYTVVNPVDIEAIKQALAKAENITEA